jgi:type IV secretion system protein VirB10
MRLNRKFVERLDPANDRDPREGQGAEVIDLATRNTLPAVTQRKMRSDGLTLAGGVAAVALLGALTFWSMDTARLPEPAKTETPTQTVVPAPAPAAVPPAAVAAPAPAPLIAPPPQAVLAAAPQPVIAGAPAAKPYSSPTMVFDASNPAGLVAQTAPGASAGTGNSNDDFASRLGGMNGNKAVATASVNPRTTVTQGTLIPAVLETAIDTDVPGYVRAVVSTDVKSFDGTRVLVPRSSRLIGQYKSGLQAGQKRAYVIWTRLIRPDGVSVEIGSPAVSFSGETGLAGRVNSHFFERFGSAMLLSVVGGLSAIGGNAGVVVGGSGQSAAAAAVGQSGQIGPTVRVRQGEPIRVFTARDLDFSKVSK